VKNKVKKGFKTAPSIRIPRASAEKMHAAAAAAAAEENALQVERLRLVCVTQRMYINKSEKETVPKLEFLRSSNDRLYAETGQLREHLRECVAMIDATAFGGGRTYRCLSTSELQRLEDMRDLSLGV
jgi:hypothetical protein